MDDSRLLTDRILAAMDGAEPRPVSGIMSRARSSYSATVAALQALESDGRMVRLGTGARTRWVRADSLGASQ